MLFPPAAFQADLLQWFHQHGKDYPWRRTTDPWAILVSEIMLQQTTIPTILNRYEAWMQQFPTPAHLAMADDQVALRSWEGLGYYRRVRSLRAIATIITQKFEGVFPQEHSTILALPGIGDYTAAAILSFAYNQPATLVDANVARVIARLDNYTTPIDSPTGKKYIYQRATQLLNHDHPRDYNSALMELGQTHCKPANPTCRLCPVRTHCTCANTWAIPVKLPKAAITKTTHHDLLWFSPTHILLHAVSTGRHAGMYRLPQRTETELAHLPCVLTQTYSVTRYKVTQHIYHCTSPTPPKLAQGDVLITLDDLQHTPLASPDRRAITQLI